MPKFPMAISFADLIKIGEWVYLERDDLHPWVDIVRGTWTITADGRREKLIAVDVNTFRGFHKFLKEDEGPKETFVQYFVSEKRKLAKALAKVTTEDQLHELSKKICKSLILRLTNIMPDKLESFNKVRKPVDLYIESLVTISKELAHLRHTLVPLLFLPLDSQLLNHYSVFSDGDLRSIGLSRGLSFGDIRDEATYLALQRLAKNHASLISSKFGKTFHRVYYDLLWNERFTKFAPQALVRTPPGR